MTLAALIGPAPTAAERVSAAMHLERTAIIGAIACAGCAMLYLAVGAWVSCVSTVLTGCVFVGSYFLVRPDRVHGALFALAAASSAAFVVTSYELGGLTSPAVVWMPLLVRATYLVLGVRAALPSAALTVGAILITAFVVDDVPLLSTATLDAIRAGSLVLALITAFLEATNADKTSRAALRLMEDTNAQLARARDAAEAASKLKSEFVATVTHELRTPLNAIVGMNGLLLESTLDERQRDYARTTRGAADTLVVLVDGLLESSRLEAGRVALQPAPCDLHLVVESVRDMLALRARDKGLTIDVEMPGELPRVVADVGRLRQVLTILLDNAVKFTGCGRVRLRAVALAGATAGVVDVTFTVEDTGIGIPPDKLELIFERFRQADSSTTRRYGGSGLGLAIARDLLALMGGTITVRSAPGAGSTFTAAVTLPRAEAVRSLEGTRVLLAEDNVVNQRLAVYLLGSLGCVVDVAADGAEAVRLASERSYDVVLMDCHMPEMDGYRAAAAIRARVGPALPIIALTAAGSAEDVVRARAAGMDGLLQKPIDIEGMRASLARIAPAARV